jgi:hypothetical protein
MLSSLALLWGASFMFIKVAVRDLTPATLIMCRLGLAALTLAALAPFTVGTRETLSQLRANARWLVIVALINTALAFWLLSWGETRIDSGLASIIQAAVPIFNAVIAFGFFRDVRVTGARLLGVAIGFVGAPSSSARSRRARCSVRSPSSGWRCATASAVCSPASTSGSCRPTSSRSPRRASQHSRFSRSGSCRPRITCLAGR